MRPRAPLEAADLGVRLCQSAARSVYACYAVAYIPVAALALASFEIATLAADAALVLVQAVARSHDTVRAFARGVRAADDAAPTLGSAGPGVGSPAVADVDLAALVAVALVHATRLPARRFAVRQDSAARQASAPPQARHSAADDVGIRDGGDVSRRHGAVAAHMVCAGRERSRASPSCCSTLRARFSRRQRPSPTRS